MVTIVRTLRELSKLYETLNSIKVMTAEEFIKSKRVQDCAGGQFYYRISEKDALKAIEIARNEKNNAVGMQGLVCPKCGRVYSPFRTMCDYCMNQNYSQVTC